MRIVPLGALRLLQSQTQIGELAGRQKDTGVASAKDGPLDLEGGRQMLESLLVLIQMKVHVAQRTVRLDGVHMRRPQLVIPNPTRHLRRMLCVVQFPTVHSRQSQRVQALRQTLVILPVLLGEDTGGDPERMKGANVVAFFHESLSTFPEGDTSLTMTSSQSHESLETEDRPVLGRGFLIRRWLLLIRWNVTLPQALVVGELRKGTCRVVFIVTRAPRIGTIRRAHTLDPRLRLRQLHPTAREAARDASRGDPNLHGRLVGSKAGRIDEDGAAPASGHAAVGILGVEDVQHDEEWRSNKNEGLIDPCAVVPEDCT